MLTHFAPGDYRYLAAPGRPFSSGVVADPGFDLVHAAFLRPIALRDGLDAARRHVEGTGRPVTALAAFELRIPEPLSRDGFDAFNAAYVERMAAMGLVSGGGESVTARTNVAPEPSGVAEPSVYAFTYTVPGRRAPGGAAFRLSGAAETRPGSTASKLASIVEKLEERMHELGVGWPGATAVNLYGPAADTCGLDEDVLRRLGPAVWHGLTWFPSRPPVHGLEYEIDVRATGTGLRI